MPATRNVQGVAARNSSPVSPEPSAVPISSMRPSGSAAWTAAQSTRMNANGHAAAIQPIVPPMRMGPNSAVGSFMWAKAIELVIEIVGT